MDMVIQTDFDMLDGETVFPGDIVKELFDLIFKSWRHPLVAILCSPNDVVVEVVDTCPTMCIFRIIYFHVFIIPYLVTLCNKNGRSSRLKKPSFLALTLKIV